MDRLPATGRRRCTAPAAPTRRAARAAALALVLFAATGCQTAMSSSAASSSAASAAAGSSVAGSSSEWPLRFQRHRFGAYCFDTWGCQILYNGFPHGRPEPEALSPSAASYGADLRERMKGGHLDIRNFPGPAEVRWRAKDKTELQAQIDIAEIFRDQLVRHEVPREDIADGASIGEPEIILEVDDRTINVYSRCFIPLKRPQDPANPHSDYRADLIKVFSRSY